MPRHLLLKLKHRRVLGETLRTYRKSAGFTQEELAEKADLNPKYIGEVERGRLNISVDALVRITKALHIRVQDVTRGF